MARRFCYDLAMLERLEVRNLGIIDEVVLEPPPGFVALTGETGAGKSLLVESLKLLAGRRAQADMVRSGAAALRVDGWFSMPEPEAVRAIVEEVAPSAADELVIRREVAASGRSRAWLNDVPVTAATLQRLAPHLLAIHGQHEQYGLADPALQRRLVDEHGGLADLADRVSRAFGVWEAAARRAQELDRARAHRRDRLDAIAFQIAEIDAVAPDPGEEEELRRRRAVLRNAVRILELGGSFLERLSEKDGAAVAELARAEREAVAMAECGLETADIAARVHEALVLTEEVVRDVAGLVRDVGEDPGELEAVETRLHRLEQLMLKYGSPIEAVIEHRARLLAERKELAAVEDLLEEAKARAAAALGEYEDAARKLDAARETAGAALVEAVVEILAGLEMGGTRLAFRWMERPDPASPLVKAGSGVRFDASGIRECELQIAANPGEELRPLSRVASGGELSRVHLALRAAVLGRNAAGRLTLLFDEVDTGLGGGTAAALGGVLAGLAERDQVLVVTHLPQVAARAEGHFRVEKVVEGERAVTRLALLRGEERVAELARMVAGEKVEQSALDHARALLDHG